MRADIEDLRSVHEVVLHRLRDAILEGKLAPGTRLKLTEVVAQWRLESDGWRLEVAASF